MLSFQFDNRFANELPGDPERGPQRRQVHGALWSHAPCTPVAAPRTLAVAAPVARLLDIDSRDLDSEQFAAVFAGNQLLPGMQPIASNYGGHQFGQWAGQLGDGRAISLGETINSRGERWELQLKGAGPTPYSRGADGRAVLRSSLREFVCSEAMVALGVPSTRALSLVASGDTVVRDMFYDGNPQAEPGAIVCRVAPSFIRLGHFELPASRGEHALLNQLIDFTIDRDFPHISGSNARADWFVEVCERTALLMAHWMRVGFVHGVMNTDNLSILGLSIDYGPYGWLEDFDPNWTPNTTDAQGRRYRYGAQPEIAHWNLGAFASALASVFEDQAPLHAGMQAFAETFTREHARMNAQKLGLSEWREEDLNLTRGLFQWMQAAEVDMPLFFRRLAELDPASASLSDFSAALYSQSKAEAEAQSLQDWLAAYRQRLESDPAPPTQRAALMNAANPLYVPRNWLCQQAIDEASKGELGELQALMKVLADPYRQQPNAERFALKRPEWARVKAGCSMLSCSS